MFFPRCKICRKTIPPGDWDPVDDDVWQFCREHRPATPTPVEAPKAPPVDAASPFEPRGFDEPEDGSQARYEDRRQQRPWVAHTFWWFVHNAIAHPLLVLPIKPAFQFHDWTSRRMHGRR